MAKLKKKLNSIEKKMHIGLKANLKIIITLYTIQTKNIYINNQTPTYV